MRYASCIAGGPSIERPTRKDSSWRNAAHSSSSRVPLVCIVNCIGRSPATSRAYATARRKKSTPRSVGSPPWNARSTSGVRCASIVCRIQLRNTWSAIRNRSPGYNNSFDRKKQYVQSRLQIAPDGFAIKWNAGGAPRGNVAGSRGLLTSGTGSAWGSTFIAPFLLDELRADVRQSVGSADSALAAFGMASEDGRQASVTILAVPRQSLPDSPRFTVDHR